jgi:hypothetical protein
MESRPILGWSADRAKRAVSTRAVFWPAALSFGLVLCGCGMPGAPQPPSLNLPDRVTDLSASRAGGQVALTWTMPKRNTDKLLLKGDVQTRVCRKEGNAGACVAAASLTFAPGADATFNDTLPAPLTTGAPRALTYFVELVNRKGRSAGLSNGAELLAGDAPAAVAELTATMAKDGVLLQWAPGPSETGPAGTEPTTIRLERKLLSPPKPKAKSAESPLAPPAEPEERTLLVPAGAHGRALDKDIRFGESYEYRAQRVASVTAGAQELELAGPFSAAVRIDAVKAFPPEAPAGLAAVATAGEEGIAPAIDLSWQPDTDSDLAGYIVYRREAGGAWQRISPAQLVVGPGYPDANVRPGHTYTYSVSAVDEEGHESARSIEAQETVPGP